MIYKIGCFLIVFIFQFILCGNSTWHTVVSSEQKFVIKKQSLNEERVKSSRVRGELGIIADSSKLSFFINWGDFANLSDANIYYYINRVANHLLTKCCFLIRHYGEYTCL